MVTLLPNFTVSSRARRVWIVVALGAVLSVVLAVSAIAQESPASPLADQVIAAQMWCEAEPNATILIVGAQIPTSTPLPTVVELPLPMDAMVQWAGEIADSGNPEDDLSRDWEIVDAEGGRAVSFTVEQYHGIQYEAAMPPVALEGDRLSASITWVQSTPSGGLSFAWRVPAGTEDVRLEPDAPGSPATNPAGERLFTLQTIAPAVGEEVTFEASYARAGLSGGGDPGQDLLVPLLLGTLLAAVLALVVVIVRERRAAPPLTEDELRDPVDDGSFDED